MQLFGGAIEMYIPEAAIDASQFRQIPDHQYVFCFPDSTDSIIVELLEPTDLDIHFQELVDLNETTKVNFIEKSDIIVAELDCSKFNQSSHVIITIGKKLTNDCDILVSIHSDKNQKDLLLQILGSIDIKDPGLFI
jgi:hypothetical protein